MEEGLPGEEKEEVALRGEEEEEEEEAEDRYESEAEPSLLKRPSPLAESPSMSSSAA